jgi:hypothetical protein
MTLVNPNFTETELEQPWKAWVHHGFPKPEESETDSDNETEELCPGGTECGDTPHKLGSTKFCAFAVKTLKGGPGPTGTSG